MTTDATPQRRVDIDSISNEIVKHFSRYFDAVALCREKAEAEMPGSTMAKFFSYVIEDEIRDACKTAAQAAVAAVEDSYQPPVFAGRHPDAVAYISAAINHRMRNAAVRAVEEFERYCARHDPSDNDREAIDTIIEDQILTEISRVDLAAVMKDVDLPFRPEVVGRNHEGDYIWIRKSAAGMGPADRGADGALSTSAIVRVRKVGAMVFGFAADAARERIRQASKGRQE